MKLIRYLKKTLYIALIIPVFILVMLSLGIEWAGRRAVALMDRLENETS